MMTAQKLFDVLFSLEHLPPELENPKERERLSRYIDRMIGFSHHAHNQLLFSAGQQAPYLYFVDQGLVRGYNYDPATVKEHTVIFWNEGSIFTDPSGFFKKLPAGLNVEVLAGSRLMFISRSQLSELYNEFPYTEIFTGCLTSIFASYFAGRAHQLVTLSAWKRYQLLLQLHPGIDQKISKELIASYIDVAPQSLSRILKENRGF